MQTPLDENPTSIVSVAAMKKPDPPDLLKWMQTFELPPPGEFDQTAVRWEASETQFGGKDKIPVRKTVIPAHRAEDFVAGYLLAPLHALSVLAGASSTHHACTAHVWGYTCSKIDAARYDMVSRGTQ